MLQLRTSSWPLFAARLGSSVVLTWAATGCSVYDGDLISSALSTSSREAEQTEAAGGRDRARDRDAATADAAEAEAADADGGEPTQRGIPVDTTVCGDARVSGPEKCDVAIPEGRLGACPTECPELRTCAPRELNGTGCQAECVLLELVCASGDACCPGKCNVANDADCSSSCGDGIIQASSGETCEPDTNTPCKQSESECDDGDPCTLDSLSGSADNCNTVCVNTPKEETVAGDGCCAPGANANLDGDCQPRCGNGVREAGEECDGESGCGEDCRATRTPEQLGCLERFGEGDECVRCSCLNCTDSYLACRAGPDEMANSRCSELLSCARTNNCIGDSCYCDGLCVVPGDGACAAEIEAAAGTTDPLQIRLRRSDLASTLGRAYATEQCRVERCGDVCR